MSNNYWIDKTDHAENILAEDFNNAFVGIRTDIEELQEIAETERIY